MNRTASNDPPPFDLLANPFHVLGIAPTSTIQLVESSILKALPKQTPSADVVLDLNIILDPLLRLPHELGYPVDGSQTDVEIIYTTLDDDNSLDSQLALASRLPCLSRANFLAHLAGHQPANEALLTALMEAHASVNVSEVFEVMKAVRASAGLIAPSLLNLNQGLVDLFDHHLSRTAIERYGTLEAAAARLLSWTESILSQGDLHHIEALDRLLAQYRRSVVSRQPEAIEFIESFCAVPVCQTSDTPNLEELQEALHGWLLIRRPLILWDAHHRAISQQTQNL